MRSSPVSLTSGADVSRRTALMGLAAAPLLIGAAPIPPDPTVDCKAGRFAGTREGGINIFRGIRYGRAERFRAPVAERRAAGLIHARDFGASSPQSSGTAPTRPVLRKPIRR